MKSTAGEEMRFGISPFITSCLCVLWVLVNNFGIDGYLFGIALLVKTLQVSLIALVELVLFY